MSDCRNVGNNITFVTCDPPFCLCLKWLLCSGSVVTMQGHQGYPETLVQATSPAEKWIVGGASGEGCAVKSEM